MSRGAAAGVAERYRTQNLEAAIAILADPHRDEDSLPVQWAHLFLANDARENEWRLIA